MLSEKTLKDVRRLKPKAVLLQIPEGLKTKAQEISSELEAQGPEVFISCDPCFGACDLRSDEAKRLGCDIIVHVGHSSLGVKSSVPVLYDHWEMKIDTKKVMQELGDIRPHKKIGLVASLQYARVLTDVRKMMEKRGFKTFAEKNKTSGIIGQVLGCEYSAAKNLENKVDCFLFFGSGRFHPLGLAAATEKPVFLMDVENMTLVNLKNEMLKEKIKKHLRIEKARECKTFGILVSTKPGQARPKEALRAKNILEKKGKRSCILSMDMFTPEGLMGIKVDCYVNTACPRMTGDFSLFGKTIIGLEDLQEL